MPRIGIAGPLRFRHLELDRGQLLQAEPAAFRLRLARHGRGAFFLVVGIHGAGDVGGLQFAAADRRHHLFDRGARQPRQRAGELLVGITILARWNSRSTMRRPSPVYCVRTAARVARRIAARALPVTTRDSHAAGGAACAFEVDDLDFVAIDEFGRQRRDLAVDLAADRRVADVGMNRISEIDRRRLARQRDQLAL